MLSAYTQKNGSTVTQVADALAPTEETGVTEPVSTPETRLASPNATNDSIAQFGEDVNPRPDKVTENEKAPAAERASRATFDDLQHQRVIKRQNGSVTDQSGTLTKDDLFVIGAVADKFGLDINILNKMDDGSWGEFVRIMHQINLSSKSDLFSSFMHELGHVIEFWAPEKFAGIKYGFRDFIIQKYGTRTMSDLLDDVKARYGNISDDAALVELACDQLEVVRDVESFAEEVAENLSKAGYTQSKIRQFLRDIADFLKRAADVIRSWAKGKDGKGGAKTAAGVYAERDAAYCKQLAEKFLDAADTAAENYKAHANGESSDVGIRSSEADTGVKKMNAPKSDDYVDLSFEKELADKIGNIHGAEKYKIIANYILEKTNGTVTFSDGFSAIIDKRDSLHIANKAADKKTAEISAVNDLIKKAQYYAYADRVEHNKFDYFKYYWANVKYGKDVFPVFFNLGRGKYDRTYHLYDITHKISDTAHRVNDVGRPRRFRPANGITTDSIPQNGDLSTPDLETHKMMPPSAAENYKAHANGESSDVGIRSSEADTGVKKMIANTKNMSWERQISGFLGKKGILKRSDSLVLNNFSDNIVSENNLPNIIPVAVLSKSKSGKDISHSLNDETLRTLEKDIINWSIAIKDVNRGTVSYVFYSESENLPVFASFIQDSEFDKDKGNIARTIHLRTNLVSTINALDNDSIVYIKNNKPSKSSRSLLQAETLTTKARLVYMDDNTSSVKSQEKIENDAKYLSAVKSGDMETAQRMVEEAAKAAGYTADESWKMDHRAPNSDDDTAHSMDDINGAYGGDDSIYDKRAAYYYGEGRSYDGQAISVIRSARNNPDKPIKVYRAVPTDIKDTRMRNGDWVAIVKDYAEEHGDRVLDGDFRIIENTVPAKHLYNNGDSINEWGYDNGNRDEVYKNTENNVKLQTVTYDDEGNVIPLSERFNEGNNDIRYMRPQEQSEVDELRRQLETERAERADYEKKTKAVIREQKKMIRALKESAATGGKHIVSFESTQDVIRRLNGQYGTRLSLSDDTAELTFVFILLNKKI